LFSSRLQIAANLLLVQHSADTAGDKLQQDLVVRSEARRLVARAHVALVVITAAAATTASAAVVVGVVVVVA
jgi:hypothetical protein